MASPFDILNDNIKIVQPVAPPEIYELSDACKKIIIERMEKDSLGPPSLRELAKLCFNENIDGRDRRAKLIKEFCAKMDFKPKTAMELGQRHVELTEEHKTFILNHCNTMSACQIAKELFNNPILINTSPETVAVNNHIKILNPAVRRNDDIPEDAKYKPPRTRDQCIAVVEKYVHERIDKTKLNQSQWKNVDSLISHLHVFRFIHQISNYDSQLDRDLFESTFVRYTWPKAADLSSEEVDQFIVLSSETVIDSSIKKRIETLQRLLDDAAENNGEDKRSVSMALVEAISKLNTEYHQHIIRQQKLLDDLNGKRSARIKDRVSENQSLVSLIEFWKGYENRQQLIALAELRKNALKEEVVRIKNLDQMKAEIFGIGEDIVDA